MRIVTGFVQMCHISKTNVEHGELIVVGGMYVAVVCQLMKSCTECRQRLASVVLKRVSNERVDKAPYLPSDDFLKTSPLKYGLMMIQLGH